MEREQKKQANEMAVMNGPEGRSGRNDWNGNAEEAAAPSAVNDDSPIMAFVIASVGSALLLLLMLRIAILFGVASCSCGRKALG
mmetsp:Transcript_42571/g.72616  ORF Transcript_42571/g.72616 Transcript_42571/m.72616 type:complete len:84 (+) Transcript_42571:277-528(+)